MVDLHSRYRLYGLGYTAPILKYPVATRRELYHETAPLVHRGRRPPTHDCREEVLKEHTERTDWEAWLLSHGLNETYRSVHGMHEMPVKQEPGTKRKPDKLLFNLGMRGKADGDFNYPRGLTVNLDGDIFIADSLNHRIQIFNQFGIYKAKFGSKGNGSGQFNEPTGITELPNGDLAVADKGNHRVQVFTSDAKFKFEFRTGHPPYCIVSDNDFNMALSTTRKTIEVYRRGGKLLNSFPIGSKREGSCGVQICVNDKQEVIVSDAADALVKIFTFQGQLLYKFEPLSNGEGLATIPSAICLTPLDQIILADALNHTVSLYTERGVLLQQLVCPTDDAGSVQTCAVGPEGHLIVTEYSITGQHCLKIFRYRECVCHLSRPGSSKRRTPTTPS